MRRSNLLSTAAKLFALITTLTLAPLSSAEESTATVTAVVESVILSKHMLKVAHDPVPAWGLPKMKMKFAVAEGVDLSAIKEGQRVELHMKKGPDGKITVLSAK
jgi:Cu/Ag efflux protein CusF